MKPRLAILMACLALVCPMARAAGADLSGTTSGPSSSCVQVEIGGQKAPDWSCLNQKMQDEVGAISPAAEDVEIAPLNANSSSLRTGGFNQSAMSQQYGSNWGKSATPYRPPAAVYGNPLRAGAPLP